MPTAESSSHCSAVVLMSKGLTPGKLRGLQRISNPNGTLTMVALDQNSSMIEMAAKALKSKGQDREPTYDEIVEAKVDLAKNLAPSASGVLIDAYYGAWSCVAAGAIGPQTGLLVRVEMSGSPKNKVGAPLGLIEPGWSVEKIKLMGADAVKLLAQYEPTEPHSAEHQFELIEHVYAECKKHDILMLLETVAFPFGGEKKTDPNYHQPESRNRHRLGPPAQPVLRHLQSRVPRKPGSRLRQATSRQSPGAECVQRTALGPPVSGRRLPRLLQASPDGPGSRRLRRARRASFLERVFPPGRRTATQPVRRNDRLQTSRRCEYAGSGARYPLVRPIRVQQGADELDQGHGRLACPLWLVRELICRRHPRKKNRRGRLLNPPCRVCQARHVRKPPLWKDTNAHLRTGSPQPVMPDCSPGGPPECVLFGKNLYRPKLWSNPLV